MMVTTVFFLLMVKHFVCDFALQGRFKEKHDKHLVSSTKGHLHALDHAVGTALVFLFVASYAFAKGHSASYAVESYQSLFLNDLDLFDNQV